MKTLTIRNVPDELYSSIVKIARKNRRSMQQEILSILEKARIVYGESPVDRAKKIRLNLTGRKLGDAVKEIRAERNR